MKKIKKEVKKVVKIVNPVKEQLTGLLRVKVPKLFSREPNSSIQDNLLAELVEEIIKLK